MLRTILTLTLLAGLAACSSNKTAKKANTLVDEHNRLGAWLTQTRPDAAWTTADLDGFEGKLNRYAAVDRQLRGMDGKDGVSIRGGSNESFILGKRTQLSIARYQKANPNAELSPERSRSYRRRADLEQPVQNVNDELAEEQGNELLIDEA